MKQEVRVTLTLEVDITQEKSDIERFVSELINTHTLLSSAYNRMIFSIHSEFKIKEESEIYDCLTIEEEIKLRTLLENEFVGTGVRFADWISKFKDDKGKRINVANKNEYMTTRLFNSLYSSFRKDWGNDILLIEITKDLFMEARNACEISWNEFVQLRGY